MDSMTSAERIRAALCGEAVDRLPWSPFLAYWWEAQPEALRQGGQLAFLQSIGADPLWRGAPCPVRSEVPDMQTRHFREGDRNVTQVTTPVGSIRWAAAASNEGSTHFLVEHPLKTREDYRVQLWIEEHTRLLYDPTPVLAHLAGEGREGLSIGMLIPRGKTAFQNLVEHLVGTEELAYALADFPAEVEELLAVMTEQDLKAAALASQAPYTFFLTWEDSSTQNYSPTQYRRHIQPEIAAFCRILRGCGKHYIQHACGHVRALLTPMRESGVLAVESLSPNPTGNITLAAARSALGTGCGIIGGIEPVAFLRRSDAEFPAYVEQVIADGAGGPFVLANSDSCPPGVARERFQVVSDVVRRSAVSACVG